MNNNYDPNQQSQYQQAPQYQQPQYQQQYNQNQQYQDPNQQYYQQQYQDPNQQYYQQQYQDPNQQYYQQQYYNAQPAPAEDPSAFRLAIVSAIASGSVYLSLIGFILAIVAKSKLKKLFEQNAVVTGKMKAAKIISNISFGVGLGLTIYMAICIFIIVAAAIAGNSY